MNIVRTQCFDYVKDWDYHTIRKQKNRPNSVTGKPFMLYYAPGNGTKSYGHIVDQQLVDNLLSTFTNHGEFHIILSIQSHYYAYILHRFYRTSC